MKRFIAILALVLFAGAATVALPGFAQMEPTGDKLVAFGTATADNADATLAAPTSGNLVIYQINATCETAAAMTITVVEDPGGTPVTLADIATAATANHVIDFRPLGLIVSAATNVRVRLATCGGGVDGNVTVLAQREIGS